MRLLKTQFFTIDFDLVRSIVRFTRSAAPFHTTEEIHAEARRISTALAMVGKTRRLLVDLRAVALRNDPDFERAIVDLRRRIYASAARRAVLVRTAVGALQLTRHLRDDGVSAEVFESEDEAIAYLTQGQLPIELLPPSSRRAAARAAT